ncbi:hypothetical protein GQ43DRAFT_167743 [Delitschia confertaspora ATCC 74209]|uniref:Uncharacterized protein n=1 Tax=Delitschia confertaspora ATCC 74209 TaxID=1513339 RepID=A0A9P4JRW6_9PLEO|nr:hypothetical protein GQ43DRAFT_167743 [Delitschia confertaspora ATCC 74209]
MVDRNRIKNFIMFNLLPYWIHLIYLGSINQYRFRDRGLSTAPLSVWRVNCQLCVFGKGRNFVPSDCKYVYAHLGFRVVRSQVPDFSKFLQLGSTNQNPYLLELYPFGHGTRQQTSPY